LEQQQEQAQQSVGSAATRHRNKEAESASQEEVVQLSGRLRRRDEIQPQHLYLRLSSLHLLQQHKQQHWQAPMFSTAVANSTASTSRDFEQNKRDPWCSSYSTTSSSLASEKSSRSSTRITGAMLEPITTTLADILGN